MMATALWRNLQDRGGNLAPRQNDSLRPVAFRLAAQTVVLLMVMLIALELVVYVITRQALLGSLEDTLKTRANQVDRTACVAFGLSCGPIRDFRFERPGAARSVPLPNGLPRGRSIASPVPGFGFAASEASVVYVNQQLRVVHGDGVLRTALLDPGDVSQTMRTGKAQCCAVRTYQEQRYLVYTKPLLVRRKVVGASQTSISEHQYLGTMTALVKALLAVALLGLLLSAAITTVLVRRALRPIRSAIARQREFVADAAHELRTPLAIMRTVGEVGMTDPSVDELQSTVVRMLSENQHLTRLVEDLSLLARADTDTVAIERRPVDLSSLVVDTVTELKPLAQAQGVMLEVDAPESAPTFGDILRLRQLLLILLDNALKHTPSGGTVEVRVIAQGSRARLEVADSGAGIDPADLAQIFDRFYRADRARSGEASGLGLAIGKWIAEAHGGQIRAGNVAPQGAIFSVSLPLAGATVSS